jgi:hypothetical protein
MSASWPAGLFFVIVAMIAWDDVMSAFSYAIGAIAELA